jgi:ketosteroid isomerase-like protein
MAEREIELLRRGFRVYDEAGPSGFADYLAREDLIHPDFLFHVQDDLPNGGDWAGIEGFQEMSRSWLEAWEKFSVEPHEFIEVGEEAVLVPLTQTAVAKGSGIEVAGEFFYVIHFRDGKVEQIRLYSDREQAERAAATRATSP